MSDSFPRRICVDKMVPAELAIREAVLVVESVGADPLLTEAVSLLCQAKDKVSDYVDHRQEQAAEAAYLKRLLEEACAHEQALTATARDHMRHEQRISAAFGFMSFDTIDKIGAEKAKDLVRAAAGRCPCADCF